MKSWMSCLIVLLIAAAHADETYQDWSAVIQTNNKGYVAYTSNQDGQTFAEVCTVDSKVCEYHLYLDISCNNGSKGLTLAQAGPNSAVALSTTCTGTLSIGGNQKYDYVVDWKPLETSIFKGGGTMIGFAFALDDGRFTAQRFSLNGFKAAHEQTERLFFRGGSSATPASETF